MALFEINARYALIAACMMHVEGAYSIQSKAFRFNNPGNIETPQGQEIQYASHFAGFLALVNDIAANAGKPLQDFIAKYAPPNENNTSLYASEVSVLSGFGLDEPI